MLIIKLALISLDGTNLLIGIMKQKSFSANRLLHLEKIGFEMEAEKLRK
jgi:hypothetical protein